ncbi:hypothetical protein Tco_1490335, partial [Tanacetum coccineum]
MEDQIIGTTKPSSTTTTNGSVAGQQTLETNKSERHVWLMKCPMIVSRSLSQQQHLLESSSSSGPPVGAKVIVTVDPLLPHNDYSSTQ